MRKQALLAQRQKNSARVMIGLGVVSVLTICGLIAFAVRGNQVAASRTQTAVAKVFQTATAIQVAATKSAQQTEQALPRDPGLRTVVSSWRKVIDDTFDDNQNEWCSSGDGYYSTKDTTDTIGNDVDMNISAGNLLVRIRPETFDYLGYSCYPLYKTESRDFYAAVEVLVDSNHPENYYSAGFWINGNIDVTYNLYHNSDGTLEYEFYRILVDKDPTRKGFSSPAGAFKIGLLAQGTNWTLYINDQKVDVVSVDDSAPKYVGIYSFLHEASNDGNVTFSYDNFEFWVP